MRKSGVLMHISSLPSPYGIGTLGSEAREFIRFLKDSGQSYWQVLPVSPTGYGNSPYQCFSSFAGNPFFIDLDMLCADELLHKSDFEHIDWGASDTAVDYNVLTTNRYSVLKIAADNLLSSSPSDFDDFCACNSYWLDDYSLFMAIKGAKLNKPWYEWERLLRLRQSSALDRARAAYSSDILFYKAVQFLFHKQWSALKQYAHQNGISIIGDIPIYTAYDSADVWSDPQWFYLDDELLPIEVAGCPPDGFTEDGQLWGNPLYAWDRQRDSGFKWWIARIAHQFELYDVLRLDHFRGFDEYYAIPYGAGNAKNGIWRKGPGIDFFKTVNFALGARNYIAEDLGFLTDSVHKLLAESGLPGMKVMQFAFEPSQDSIYLPHNYTQNCVAYTGTHDNNTISGWFEAAEKGETEKAARYFRMKSEESRPRAMMSALIASAADLVVLQAQDLLELGAEGRMNTPGTTCGNWQWRMKKGALTSKISSWLREQTELYGRI